MKRNGHQPPNDMKENPKNEKNHRNSYEKINKKHSPRRQREKREATYKGDKTEESPHLLSIVGVKEKMHISMIACIYAKGLCKIKNMTQLTA